MQSVPNRVMDLIATKPDKARLTCYRLKCVLVQIATNQVEFRKSRKQKIWKLIEEFIAFIHRMQIWRTSRAARGELREVEASWASPCSHLHEWLHVR